MSDGVIISAIEAKKAEIGGIQVPYYPRAKPGESIPVPGANGQPDFANITILLWNHMSAVIREFISVGKRLDKLEAESKVPPPLFDAFDDPDKS